MLKHTNYKTTKTTMFYLQIPVHQNVQFQNRKGTGHQSYIMARGKREHEDLEWSLLMFIRKYI